MMIWCLWRSVSLSRAWSSSLPVAMWAGVSTSGALAVAFPSSSFGFSTTRAALIRIVFWFPGCGLRGAFALLSSAGFRSALTAAGCLPLCSNAAPCLPASRWVL
eukprot:9501960-Heterocapsa_arctica.AAC.1